MSCEDLIFVGMNVFVKDHESVLYGSVLTEYREIGSITVKYIYDNGNVQLSNGGMCINLHKSNLIPTLDDNILDILKRKEDEKAHLELEIMGIKDFINKTINTKVAESEIA
ncbi:MAG: hypothetical protein ACRC1P_09705 [Cellulosilyticaceae bacterium]